MSNSSRHFKHCPQCKDPLVLRKGANKLSCSLCGWVDFSDESSQPGRKAVLMETLQPMAGR